MHIVPRDGPIEKLVVHVNVGPETVHGAEDLAGYLDSIEAGYHIVRDWALTLRLCPDNYEVYGAAGMNTNGLHLCIVGYPDQSAAEWDDAYSRSELNGAAYQMAMWCHQYDIPRLRLTPQQVATRGVKGICGHVDVTASGLSAANDGHWDPGPNFPWAKFLELVQHYYDPNTSPIKPPEEEDVPNIILAPGWMTKNRDRPASVHLDPKTKSFALHNGARVNGVGVVKGQATQRIPANLPIISWAETFNNDGSKLGFTVLQRQGPDGTNAAFSYTWPKRPGT
jgi:hypothetical protein